MNTTAPFGCKLPRARACRGGACRPSTWSLRVRRWTWLGPAFLLIGACQRHERQVAANESVRVAAPHALFPPPGESWSWDAGEVLGGAQLRHEFRFANATGDVLALGPPRASCGCLVPQLGRRTLAPGETASLVVLADTLGRQGAQRFTVWLGTEGRADVLATFDVLVRVAPARSLWFEPDRLPLADIKPGDIERVEVALVSRTMDASEKVDLEASSLRSSGGWRLRQRGATSEVRDGDWVTRRHSMTLVPPDVVHAGAFSERFEARSGADRSSVAAPLLVEGVVSGPVSGAPPSIFTGFVPAGQLTIRDVPVQPACARVPGDMRCTSSTAWIRTHVSATVGAPEAGSDQTQWLLRIEVEPPSATALFEEWVELQADGCAPLRIGVTGVVR